MTREEAISVLKETIDPNVEKSFEEWKEWDKKKHLPAVNMAIEALQAEPVKHGEWENRGNRWFTCSLCDWECAFHYNYCPQCGAKMDKE